MNKDLIDLKFKAWIGKHFPEPYEIVIDLIKQYESIQSNESNESETDSNDEQKIQLSCSCAVPDLKEPLKDFCSRCNRAYP